MRLDPGDEPPPLPLFLSLDLSHPLSLWQGPLYGGAWSSAALLLRGASSSFERWRQWSDRRTSTQIRWWEARAGSRRLDPPAGERILVLCVVRHGFRHRRMAASATGHGWAQRAHRWARWAYPWVFFVFYPVYRGGQRTASEKVTLAVTFDSRRLQKPSRLRDFVRLGKQIL